MESRVFSMSQTVDKANRERAEYHEFLRVPSLSAGIYRLPTGGTDRQTPHGEDELYYVLSGRARFTCEGRSRDVQRGDLIYVPATQRHAFSDIREELELLVVFAPEERPVSPASESPPAGR